MDYKFGSHTHRSSPPSIKAEASRLQFCDSSTGTGWLNVNRQGLVQLLTQSLALAELAGAGAVADLITGTG